MCDRSTLSMLKSHFYDCSSREILDIEELDNETIRIDFINGDSLLSNIRLIERITDPNHMKVKVVVSLNGSLIYRESVETSKLFISRIIRGMVDHALEELEDKINERHSPTDTFIACLT